MNLMYADFGCHYKKIYSAEQSFYDKNNLNEGYYSNRFFYVRLNIAGLLLCSYKIIILNGSFSHQYYSYSMCYHDSNTFSILQYFSPFTFYKNTYVVYSSSRRQSVMSRQNYSMKQNSVGNGLRCFKADGDMRW